MGVYGVAAAGKIAFAAIRFLSEFLNGVTNAASPTLAIYLYSLKLDKRTFVKSLATIFVTTKLSQLVAISTFFNGYTLKLSLLVLLFSLAGFYIGLKIQDRIDQAVFNRGLLVLLAINWSITDLPRRNTGQLNRLEYF